MVEKIFVKSLGWINTHKRRKKILKMGGSRSQYPVSLPRIKLWYQWSKITQKLQPQSQRRGRGCKNYAKTDAKVFSSGPILLHSLILFHKFCSKLQVSHCKFLNKLFLCKNPSKIPMNKPNYQSEIKRWIFAISTNQLFSRTTFMLCIACASSNSALNIIIASHRSLLMSL